MAKHLPPPSRIAPQFVVRFPDEAMREQIASAAKANGRSMNAEIITRLQLSLATDKVHVDEAAQTQLDNIQAKIERVNELLDLALNKANAKKRANKKPPEGG
jgi:plasmid stability protein